MGFLGTFYLTATFSTLLLNFMTDAAIHIENCTTLHVLDIKLSQPSVVVLGLINPLQLNVSVSYEYHDVSVSYKYNDTSGSNTSSSCLAHVAWKLSVWGSSVSEPNATQISRLGQVLDEKQRMTPILPDNSTLLFWPNVSYKLDLSRASCHQGAQYICGHLIPRTPGGSGNLTGCSLGPSCKDGLVVNSLEISLNESVEIEAGNVTKLSLNVSIQYDRNLTSDVTGTNLWRLMIWSRGESADLNDTSQRLSLVEQALTQAQADQSLISGEEFRFVGVEYEFNMSDIRCSDVAEVCVRFRRGDNATYELISRPNASVRTKCIQIPRCLEIETEFVTELMTTDDVTTESVMTSLASGGDIRVPTTANTIMTSEGLISSPSPPPAPTTPLSTSKALSCSTSVPTTELLTSTPSTTTTRAAVTEQTFYQWLSDVTGDDVIVEQSAEAVSADLADWTNEISDVSTAELRMTSEVIEEISQLEEVSTEVASNVFDAVDRLISIEATTGSTDDKPRDSETADDSQQHIVKSIEDLLAKVKLSENTTSNFSDPGVNLAVASFNLAPNDDSVLADDVLQIYVKEKTNLDDAGEDQGTLSFEKSNGKDDGLKAADVSLELGTGKLFESDPEGNLRIDLIVYRNDTLFRHADSTSPVGSHGNPSSTKGGACSIQSSVLSVSIRRDEEEIKELATPINMTFRIQKTDPSYTPTCTYWDFALNDGLGDWSTLGCDLIDESRDQAVCSCDHLTNFAVLMAPSYGCHPYALDVVSQVGCIISTFGLILTIITYVMFGKQMGQTPRLIMIQWCTSLLMLYVAFVIGIDRTENAVGCTVIAAMLHYFTLSSVLWMGVEGVNLYILLVRVMDVPRTRHFIPAACLVAWGVPFVLVFISILEAGPDNYREPTFCFLSRGPHFIYALLFPLAAVLLANLVFYTLVMKALMFSKVKIRVIKMENSRMRDLATRVQQGVAIGLLTGLTWLFGFFAIGHASTAFAWLFCICNSLQGVCVFLLFCVFRPELRRAWKNRLCPNFSKSLLPKRRTTAKTSELENIRSRTTSLRDSSQKSHSGHGRVGGSQRHNHNHNHTKGTYREITLAERASCKKQYKFTRV